MDITEKLHLLLDEKDTEEKEEKTDKKKDKKKGNGDKICFHCKDKDALPGRAVCQGCSAELEAWRNKKDKKQSEKV